MRATVLIFLLLIPLAILQDRPLSSLRLTREDRVIVVNQYAPAAEGGEFRTNAPDCDEDEGIRTSTIYAPEPYLVETLVGETRISSRIVLQKRPPADRGGQNKALLEMFSGALRINPDTLCPEDIERAEVAEVIMEQGRSRIVGLSFSYDNESGIGDMQGPISLERAADGDSPALSATSGRLIYNEETDTSLLTGNVELRSEDRVSEADEIEYDEANSLAILRGSPAISRQGQDVVQGNVILYYLDSNDVVVRGNVQATLELDLGD